MKLLKIHLTIDEQNVLIKSQRTAKNIVKGLLVFILLVIAYKAYLLK